MLTNHRHQHRITGSIIVNQLGQLCNIHSHMVILLILHEHSGNIAHTKAHVYVKVRCNIPRAVVLMLSSWSDFLTKISDIMNTCQNDRLKRRVLGTFQIVPSQLSQKIQKHLVVAGTVYFVDHQHNWLR